MIKFIILNHYIQHITLHKSLVCLAITNLKYKDFNNFYHFLLLLSGDLNLNPGAVWEPLKKKGLHLLHIKSNSFLPKINKLKCIVNKTKATIIGITESKLDNTVSDPEVNLPGYDIL